MTEKRETPSEEPTCGRCGKSITSGDAKHHYGWWTGHSPERCCELLKREASELAERVAELHENGERLMRAADGWKEMNDERVRLLHVAEERVAELELENEAIRELMNCYNLGGWTDAIAPMKRALSAETKLLHYTQANHALEVENAELRGKLRESGKHELVELMSEISEDCWAAGWMSGLEFRLWDAITDPNDDRRYGMGEIKPQQVERLRELSALTDGWWVWEDDRAFISLDEWKRRLALLSAAEREA